MNCTLRGAHGDLYTACTETTMAVSNKAFRDAACVFICLKFLFFFVFSLCSSSK